MENFDNWEMLKTAVEAKETEEILTREIITDYENITMQEQAGVIIKQETVDNEDDYNGEMGEATFNNAGSNNYDFIDDDDYNLVIKNEALEISVDETHLAVAHDDNSMDDDAIFNFAPDTPVANSAPPPPPHADNLCVEDSSKQESSCRLTLGGRPVRAAALAKSGQAQKLAVDELTLNYEAAIIFICPACASEYYTHDEWKRHMHEKHAFYTREGLNFKKIDKIYNECQQCFKHIAMHSMENLLKHKFTHLPFRCTKCRICKREYKYRQDLMVHLRMVHIIELENIQRTGVWSVDNKVSIDRDISCNDGDGHDDDDDYNDEDDDVCVQNERLELDEDEHLVEYDYKQKCQPAGQVKVGFSEANLKLCQPYLMHTCPQCGDTYENEDQWRMHIGEKHNFDTVHGLGYTMLPNGNSVKCEKCPKVMKTDDLNQLQFHRFTHTAHRQWLRCSLCYRGFIALKDLVTHLLVHHTLASNPPDDADMANYQMDGNYDSFEKHIEYLCPKCGKIYKDRKMWRRHLIYVHRFADLKVLRFRVVNDMQVSCLDCHKVITNAYGFQNAQQHHFTHLPYKAFTRCRLCGKSYTERKGTVKHLRNSHAEELADKTRKIPAKSISSSNSIPHSEETMRNNVRFEDNNGYYNRRTIEPSTTFKENKEIVTVDNYIFEIKYLDDDNSLHIEDNAYDDDVVGDNNTKNYDDNIDDDAAVPELMLHTDNSRKPPHNATQYKCNYCAARFTHPNLLTCHIIDSHKEKKTQKFEGKSNSINNCSSDDEEQPPAKKKRTEEPKFEDSQEISSNRCLENYYYFLCPSCGLEFPQKSSWHQHINEIHHFNKRNRLNFKAISPHSYQCLECKVVVNSKLQTMQEHKFGHLPNMHCVKCRLCSTAFSYKSSMLEHLVNVHKLSKTPNINISAAVEQLNPIRETETTEISPTTPSVSFNSEYGHNAVDHATITYFCPLCNENFLTHYMWRRHIVNVHNLNSCTGLNFRKINENHFMCLECYKRVTVTHTKGAICQLQSHKFRHLPYRSFKCTACNEMFVRKQMFFKHLNRATNTCGFIKEPDKPEKNSKKSMKSYDTAKNDNKSSNLKNTNGQYDKYPDQNRQQLQQTTMNEDSGEDEENMEKDGITENQFMFSCPVCGEEFNKLYSWREHINDVHFLNKRHELNFQRMSATQHQCMQCMEYVNGKKLRDLQAHKFKHLTKTNYLRCLVCKLSFAHLRNMQDHVRFRHPKEYVNFCSYDGTNALKFHENSDESTNYLLDSSGGNLVDSVNDHQSDSDI